MKWVYPILISMFFVKGVFAASGKSLVPFRALTASLQSQEVNPPFLAGPEVRSLYVVQRFGWVAPQTSEALLRALPVSMQVRLFQSANLQRPSFNETVQFIFSAEEIPPIFEQVQSVNEKKVLIEVLLREVDRQLEFFTPSTKIDYGTFLRVMRTAQVVLQYAQGFKNENSEAVSRECERLRAEVIAKFERLKTVAISNPASRQREIHAGLPVSAWRMAALSQVTALVPRLEKAGIQFDIQDSPSGMPNIVIRTTGDSAINRFAKKQFLERRGLRIIFNPIAHLVGNRALNGVYLGDSTYDDWRNEYDPETSWGTNTFFCAHSISFESYTLLHFQENSFVVRHELEHADRALERENKNLRGLENVEVASVDAVAKTFFEGIPHAPEELIVQMNDILFLAKNLVEKRAKEFPQFIDVNDGLIKSAINKESPSVEESNLLVVRRVVTALSIAVTLKEVNLDLDAFINANRTIKFISNFGRSWALIHIHSKERGMYVVGLPDLTSVEEVKSEIERLMQQIRTYESWLRRIANALMAAHDAKDKQSYPEFLRSIVLPEDFPHLAP